MSKKFIINECNFIKLIEANSDKIYDNRFIVRNNGGGSVSIKDKDYDESYIFNLNKDIFLDESDNEIDFIDNLELLNILLKITRNNNIILYNGYYGVIDKNGNWLIKPNYSDIIRNDNNTWSVVNPNDNKVGLYDNKFMNVIPPLFDQIDFHDNYYFVIKNDKEGLIDVNFNQKTDIIYDTIYKNNNNFIVYLNNKKGYLDNDFNFIPFN